MISTDIFRGGVWHNVIMYTGRPFFTIKTPLNNPYSIQFWILMSDDLNCLLPQWILWIFNFRALFNSFIWWHAWNIPVCFPPWIIYLTVPGLGHWPPVALTLGHHLPLRSPPAPWPWVGTLALYLRSGARRGRHWAHLNSPRLTWTHRGPWVRPKVQHFDED